MTWSSWTAWWRNPGDRQAVIPILQALQAHYRYLPPGGAAPSVHLTEITPAQIEGVASFYTQSATVLWASI